MKKRFISFFLLCFSLLGGIIDRKISYYINLFYYRTIIVSAIAQLVSKGILVKITSISGLYCGIILLSIGMGIGVRAPVKNSCFFMPEHKGLISAIIYWRSFSPLFNFIGEGIINPENKRLAPNEKYYDYSMMRNLFDYYYIGIIGILVSAFFSL